MKTSPKSTLWLKILSFSLMLAMVLPMCMMAQLPAFAEEDTTTPDTYVQDGLFAWYDGVKNTDAGQNLDATAWEDLVGDNDLPISKSDNNHFNKEGLYITKTENFFPQPIVDLVNGQTFTVEILFGEFTSIGNDFNTFMNSRNDNFALFRRNSNNVLEFKFAANPGNERPIVQNGLSLIDKGTITITYKVGGKCRIYVDGVLCAEVACPKVMGADNLFIGHETASKYFETTYRSIRFYNRELTADEVKQNAQVDGTYVAQTGPEVPNFITVAQPVTNIAGDVAITREIDSADELSAMMAGKSLPAAMILTVNDKLQVLDKDSKTMGSLAEVLATTQYKVLPVLRIADSATITALASFVKDTGFADICVMSQNPALVNEARTKITSVRGAIDMTATYADQTQLTKEQCLDIRRTVKANAASVVVLPEAVCLQDSVQYLYDMQINVWVKTSDTPTMTQKYFSLLSGAVGVISDDTQGLLDIACDALADNTMTRVPLNVGHRGIPSSAPENTVEGSLHAYEMGADCIELDIYLTKDGKIAVMHDGTTGRTCDKNLSVEGSTWAELSELYVNKGFENSEQYKNCRIPSLEDYLKAFKGKDCRLFIEIKSSKTAIVTEMKKQIEQYDMYDQCSVITFNTGIMAAMRRDYPEMSVGALCNGYLDEVGSDGDMTAVMNFIGQYNATLNPSASGYGENAIRAALVRGIGVFPWTFRGDASVYQNHFVWGYSGLTGDNADVLKRYVKDWQVVGDVDSLKAGEIATLSMMLTYYDRREVAEDGTAWVIEGDDSAVNGNTITYQGEGSVSVVLKNTYRLGSAKVTVYTQPVVIAMAEATEDTAQETTAEEPSETQGEVSDTLADIPDSQDTANVGGVDTTDVTVDSGCASVMGSMMVLFGVVGVGCLLAKRREE